jgi:hypothetical protein
MSRQSDPEGRDSGFANTSGAGWVVKTQADRGRFCQNFTLGLLESGGCVGWPGFKYRDNDHGLSFDGRWLAISSGSGENGSQIYVVPASGGEARAVTPTGPSYWHGWSPDGKTLTYCAKRSGNFDVYTIPAAGGSETRLTDAKGLDDGPAYTAADSKQIAFVSYRHVLPEAATSATLRP